MKIHSLKTRSPRVEMLPLIDIVFLLLVVFIYTMLSMAVHKGLPVFLPSSDQVRRQEENPRDLSITVRADGAVFVDKQAVTLQDLPAMLRERAGRDSRTGVLLFADRTLPYQSLFKVLD
ncbi:MAG: biopolymer transporter ExbD, partial [Desulfosarcinaceae bacterium]